MSDLIDRKVLLENLQASRLYHTENSREMALLSRCESIVMEQPTACDTDKVLDICAAVISKLPGLCERICPIGCDYGTEESCKESWKLYLEEQLKEGVKDAEKHDKKTKYDQIRSMCVDEMASFLSEVKYDGIYYKECMEYPIISEVWKEWLQSEAESDKND